MQVKVTENLEGIATCGCGRSPSGMCDGSHAFTQEQWEQRQKPEKDLTEAIDS